MGSGSTSVSFPYASDHEDSGEEHVYNRIRSGTLQLHSRKSLAAADMDDDLDTLLRQMAIMNEDDEAPLPQYENPVAGSSAVLHGSYQHTNPLQTQSMRAPDESAPFNTAESNAVETLLPDGSGSTSVSFPYAPDHEDSGEEHVYNRIRSGTLQLHSRKSLAAADMDDDLDTLLRQMAIMNEDDEAPLPPRRGSII